MVKPQLLIKELTR